MSQISLPLDWTGREKGETFLLSASNSLAVRHLDHWGIWPVRTTISNGPPRSGGFTLGRLFVRQTGGRVENDPRLAEDEALVHAWTDPKTGHIPLILRANASPAPSETQPP